MTGGTPRAPSESAEPELGLAEAVALLTGRDLWSLPGHDGLGLAPIVLSDGPVGVRGGDGPAEEPGVLLPSPGALGATWDPALLCSAGRLLGREARRLGVHVLLAPTLNLVRSPLAGRAFECLGEDPLHVALLGASYVSGVQELGVAATAKHFVANESELDRMRYDVVADEDALRATQLLPFEEAVRSGGAWAVMAAYNRVGGVAMTEHARLLLEILKGEWGFDGVVVSDWYATTSTAGSALGGLDLVMPGPGGPWGAALCRVVEAGEVPEEAVRDKVARLLRLADRVGAIEARHETGLPPAGLGSLAAPHTDTEPPHPLNPVAAATPPAHSAPGGHDATNRPDGPPTPTPDALPARLAERSMVLLANDGVLPLVPESLQRVAWLGPAAVDLVLQGGGSAQVVPPRHCSLADELTALLPADCALRLEAGATRDEWPEPLRAGPGVHLELAVLDAGGVVLERRVLEEATVRRLPATPGALPANAAELVLRARLEAAIPAAYDVAVTGVGQFRLATSGATAGPEHELLLVPEATDPAALLFHPPGGRVQLEVGQGQVELELRHRVLPGLGMAAFALRVSPPAAPPAERLAAAVALARWADVAIVVVGTSAEHETEGVDRERLVLPGDQDALVEAVAATGTRTVVVVNAGAAVLLPWADQVDAVLWTWFPGQDGPRALASVLLGRAEPGGRLPVTLPAPAGEALLPPIRPAGGRLEFAEGVAIGYRGWGRPGGGGAAFAFGHGLGYTSWEYRSLRLVPGGAGLVAEVVVANAGSRAGHEVVQCYVSEAGESGAGESGAGEPGAGEPGAGEPGAGEPDWRLAGFAGVELAPGASGAVRVELDARRWSRWHDRAWSPVPGHYLLAAGRSVADLRYVVAFTVDEAGAGNGDSVGVANGQGSGTADSAGAAQARSLDAPRGGRPPRGEAGGT